MSTRGACGCLVVRSVDHLGKKNSKFIGTLFAFEIFEIAQKTKKLALSRYPLGSTQGGLWVPRHAQCESARYIQPQDIYQPLNNSTYPWKPAQKWLFSHVYSNLDPTLHLYPVGLGSTRPIIFCLGVPSVGHLGKKIFQIYQTHYLPLKFLKSPKKQKS